MSKLLRQWLSYALACSLLFPGAPGIRSQSANMTGCLSRDIVVGYFNGVLTQRLDADLALHHLKEIHGSTSATGTPIVYRVFYNESVGPLEDAAESLEQMLEEQDGLLRGRFELFWEALRGDGPWLLALIDAVPTVEPALRALVDRLITQGWTALAKLIADSPRTDTVFARHKQHIDEITGRGSPLLMVAHSQGNLFALSAYRYAVLKSAPTSVQVVHVAPPTRALVGSHTLADLDLLIDGLRLKALLPVADVTPPPIPKYDARSPGLNGRKDRLGHGFLEIYLSPELGTFGRIKGYINDALGSLAAQTSPVSTDCHFQVFPLAATVAVGKSLALVARLTDKDGRVLPLPLDLTWRSSDREVVSVNAGGQAMGVAIGQANVSATSPSSKIESKSSRIVVVEGNPFPSPQEVPRPGGLPSDLVYVRSASLGAGGTPITPPTWTTNRPSSLDGMQIQELSIPDPAAPGATTVTQREFWWCSSRNAACFEWANAPSVPP